MRSASSAVRSRNRRWFVPVLAVVGFSLTACGAPPRPEVSFYGNGSWTTTSPALWCTANDLLEVSCPPLENITTSLTLGKGQGVQVGVPVEVSDGFWGVTITYIDAEGNQQAAATEVFDPHEKVTFRVTVQPGEQLFEIDVHSLIPVAEDDLRIWRTWILSVNPAKAYAPPVD